MAEKQVPKRKPESKSRKSRATKSKIDPTYLVVKEDERDFVLTYKGETLKTADGKMELRHSSRNLFQHMISEFDGQGSIVIEDGRITSPIFFGAYNNFSLQKELIESEKNPLHENFNEWLLDDPVLRFQAGPEGAERLSRLSRYRPLLDWIGTEQMNSLFGLSFSYHDQLDEEETVAPESASEREKALAVVEALKKECLSASPEQQATMLALILIHEAVFLYPLALVLGHCTPAQYAQGVLTSHYGMANIFGYTTEAQQKQHIDALRADASTAMEYIQFYRVGTPDVRVRGLIAQGESAKVELKSTLRFNLHSKQNDPATITHACLKTIAAFLNTEGGALLIGVADDGSLVGIEKDGFSNPDKFLLHLTDKIKHALGVLAAGYVEPEVLRYGRGSVCIVNCRPSDTPVYCKGEGKDSVEHFYVRTGPSTTALPMSSAYDYVKTHFVAKL
jgi:hypothetical protein